MARRTEKRLRARSQRGLDPRESQDVTTPRLRPTARPVDPFEGEAAVDLRTAEALGNINKALAGYGKLQALQKPANIKRAEADFQAGKAPDRDTGFFNVGAGYMEAYHDLDNEARAIGFREEWMSALAANNYFLKDAEGNPLPEDEAQENWETTKALIYNKHLATADPRGAAGSSNILHLTDREVETKKGMMVQNMFREKSLENADKIVGQIVTDYGTASYLDTPVEFKQMARNFYKEIQETSTGQPVISPDQYTEQVIDNLGLAAINFATRANASDARRLLKVMNATDKDGINWMTVKGGDGAYKFQKQITDYVATVEGLLESAEQAADNDEKSKTANMWGQREVQFLSVAGVLRGDLSKTYNVGGKEVSYDEALVQLETQLRTWALDIDDRGMTGYDPNKYQTHLDTVATLRDRQRFPKESNEALYRDLLIGVTQRKGGMVEKVNAASRALAHDDYTSLLGKLEQHAGSGRSDFWRHIDRRWNHTKGTYGELVNMGEAKRYRMNLANYFFYEDIYSHMEENKKRPTRSEIEEYLTSATERAESKEFGVPRITPAYIGQHRKDIEPEVFVPEEVKGKLDRIPE